jgi:hypothetical protein
VHRISERNERRAKNRQPGSRLWTDLSPLKWQASGKQAFLNGGRSRRKYLVINRVPGGIRTHNLLIRSQKLYPVELQAHLESN